MGFSGFLVDFLWIGNRDFRSRAGGSEASGDAIEEERKCLGVCFLKCAKSHESCIKSCSRMSFTCSNHFSTSKRLFKKILRGLFSDISESSHGLDRYPFVSLHLRRISSLGRSLEPFLVLYAHIAVVRSLPGCDF